jgi:hypothetical protein
MAIPTTIKENLPCKGLFSWISKFVTPISVVNGDNYNNKICHLSAYFGGVQSL